MSIAGNALREKIRRKELYILAAVGLLVILVFCSGAGTITVNGEPITDYGNMISIMISVVNFISGALAIVLSLRTIPNEYERKTSHLIWIRGISQTRYHGELALANVAASLFATAVMYGGLLVFTIVKQETGRIFALLPAFLVLSISISIVSMLTSILSIRLPGMAAGLAATICYLVGVFHNALDVYRSMVTGLISFVLKTLLIVLPDLNNIQSQAGAVLLTGTYGLSVRNLFIYEEAVLLQEKMDELGFQDFRITDYPIAFFDGNKDYVVTKKGKEYKVETRKPVFSTYVGTAYEVEDHYEIILPTIESFEKMFSMLGMVENVQEFQKGNAASFEESEYEDKEQAATIWHEGFHAYQMTEFENEITEMLEGHSFSEEDFSEEVIVNQVDANEQAVDLYKQELKLLKKAALSEDVDDIKALIIKYKELEEKRIGLLQEDVLLLEEYFERMEGTARYVEGKAYEQLYSKEAFEETYLEAFESYQKGSGKYYGTGMVKCLLLDRLAPGWKQEYDFSKSLTGLLYEQIGE